MGVVGSHPVGVGDGDECIAEQLPLCGGDYGVRLVLVGSAYT